MADLIVLKIGTTFPNTADQYGDFDEWIQNGLGSQRETRVVDTEHGEDLPAVSECSGVVITGSHPNVTENLSWSIELERWLPALVEMEVPVMGICYGHQLLARAMGGEVGFHPGGKEIGTVDIDLLPAAASDPLLRGIPDRLPVQVAHAQTVSELPPGAVCLASNNFEPNQAFRVGTKAWGIQFHPEFSAAVMRSYIVEQAEELREMGMDVEELLGTVDETPIAGGILRSFARLVERDQRSGGGDG